ncbi:MAG TPA: cohesin domain-containing protein [Candidatus Mediterraneibacter norfolkensis]|nr:cohesin domain-containing protein [Candidatus Mediterraneibacter norfolkensis]
MKMMKKMAALVLAAFLAVPMAGSIVYAAEGSLQFTDPETQVGETVEVDMVIRSGGDAIGDADVTMAYDTESLEFVSGDGVESDGSGTLKYSGSGDGTVSELRTTMEFRALQSGTAQISVESSTAYLYSDETLNLDEGSSAITIEAAADGSTTAESSGTASASGETTDIVVNVDGTDYNFSEAFTAADIPAGYAETTMTFNGEERRFVANDAGVYLGYLVDSSGAGSFFLYNDEDATFSPYLEVAVSDTTSIILLNQPEQVSLPESYQQVELTVSDQTFPAWSDPSNSRFYIIYALNTRTGQEGLYQYDTEDGTYQSFTAAASDDSSASDGSVVGRIGAFVSDHFAIVFAVVAVIILLLLILMIVFAVKLVHRNQELDDLYDEYDIPMDDDEEEDDRPSVQKKSRKQFVGYNDEDEEDNEYEDDYYDEYDDDDEYEDEYDDEYDDEYEDEYEDDEVDSHTGNTKDIRRRKSSEKNDDYEMDFIDL